MKPTQIAFLVVAVFFRTAAVIAALYGLFVFLAPLLMAGLFMPRMQLRILPVFLVPAIVLWFFAKPLASLIVRDLHDEPKV